MTTQFHLMTDEFHFMTDKFHFMTEIRRSLESITYEDSSGIK